MGKREIIEIAGEVFRTKTAVKERARDVLNRESIGDTVDGEDLSFLAGLLERHPHAAQKIGPGLVAIFVGTPPGWPSQRCFWLRRTDGTETDWSFIECINASSQRAKFLSACRRAVSSQVIAFKFSQSVKDDDWMTCPVTGELITVKASHVDHMAPMTFLALVDRFLQESGIDLETVRLEGIEDQETDDRFADQSLADRWAEFHRQHARLRLVSRRANLSILRKTS